MKNFKLTELKQDNKNANRGTPRGSAQLERSIRKYGAGRSLLADKNGRLIAGNKTHQALLDSGFEDAIIVDSDGTKPVIVRRTDLDLDDGSGVARALGVADNRISEVGLEWDSDVLLELGAELDLAEFFFEDELKDIGVIEEVDFDVGDGIETGSSVRVCETCGQPLKGET